MDVVVDGLTYRPTGTAGIAVTTFNRPGVLADTLGHLMKHVPAWMPVVVVDDGSAEPAVVPRAVTLIRHAENRGIAAAKNRCIEALMELGMAHLFLFDDDTYPTTDDWWQGYVEHDEPHLMMLFPNPDDARQPARLYDDGDLYALGEPRGCMLYAEARVIDRVGGMRPEFGKWGGEHGEWSQRIHAAGLTTFPYQDVHGHHLYSMDEHHRNDPTFRRSVPESERDAAVVERSEALRKQYLGSSDYVEYRVLPNLVITTLLTKHNDPQRPKGVKLDPKALVAWKASVKGATTVVLADMLHEGTVTVPTGMTSPYRQRWFSIFQYLRGTPAAWVWCTDGTDVTMQHEPWQRMAPGKLYIGYEPTVVGCPWMLLNHPSHAAFIATHADSTLLNAGVVGGDRAIMLEFTHALCDELAGVVEGSDMGAINAVAYTRFADRLVTGPAVTSTFKANESNAWSMWRHK